MSTAGAIDISSHVTEIQTQGDIDREIHVKKLTSDFLPELALCLRRSSAAFYGSSNALRSCSGPQIIGDVTLSLLPDVTHI